MPAIGSKSITGGSTLKLDGAGLTLDLTKISNTRIRDIEIICLVVELHCQFLCAIQGIKPLHEFFFKQIKEHVRKN
jgi:hypothetical protein